MKIHWDEAAGYLLIVLASCFFGGSASLGKSLMQDGLSTIMLMQIRSILTAVTLLPLLATFGQRHLQIRKRDLMPLTLLAIPGLALVNVSYYYAVKLLTIGLAVFIQFMAPVFVFLYGYLSKKEKATPEKLLALILSLTGTFFMVQLQSGTAATISWIGLASAFTSVLSFAFYLILSHHLGKRYSPWTLILYGYGIASLFWCVVQSPVQTIHVLVEHHLWKRTILFSIFSTLVPFVLFLSGLRKVTATGGAIAATSETVTASLFAYFLLGENLTAGQILGAGFILTAILLLVYQKEKLPEVVSAD